jgi:quercetin dioxygenase-like cupin family protein
MTEEQVRERLRDLPEAPMGFMTFAEPGDFHGIVEWEVLKGKMMSFNLLDHRNCEIFHTKFSRETEVSWHSHGEESIEVIVCLEGQMLLIMEDGSQVKIEEKGMKVIPKGVKHMAVIGSKPCQIIAMTIPKEK